jgi:predicted phage terminase large subunit-like protein
LHTKEIGTPLYYSKEFYEKKKRQNEYVFYAMYQGLPIQRGNTLFKDVNYYSELPKELKYKIGSDFAYSEHTKSDFSVIVVFGYANKKHYLIDVIRYQKEIDYTEKMVLHTKMKYKSKIGIEANGTQKAVYDMISKKIGQHYFKAVQPLGDKYTRSIPFAAEWNLGNILLPDPTVFNHPWLDDYIDELMLFTGIKDTNDDQVDASVVAFNMVTQSTGVYFV